MSNIAGFLKKLMMGANIFDLAKELFDDKKQQSFALFLNDVLKKISSDNNVNKSICSIVPVPLTQNGAPVTDQEGKPVFVVRVKIIEVDVKDNVPVMGRILMDLSINDLLELAKNNLEK